MDITMTQPFVQLYERDLNKLEKEIDLYTNESLLWKKEAGINNAAGNLCLHLCGNLQHYIGAQLGNSGYNIWLDFDEFHFLWKRIKGDFILSARGELDGKYIYFNSNRTGSMQIWRMKADGSEQEPVTNGDYHDWFPHTSPDSKSIVFLSFLEEEVESGSHPPYKHVYLRLMPVTGGRPKIIAYFYGGQGSINTPSWSRDSKKIAFVSNTELTPKSY